MNLEKAERARSDANDARSRGALGLAASPRHAAGHASRRARWTLKRTACPATPRRAEAGDVPREPLRAAGAAAGDPAKFADRPHSPAATTARAELEWTPRALLWSAQPGALLWTAESAWLEARAAHVGRLAALQLDRRAALAHAAAAPARLTPSGALGVCETHAAPGDARLVSAHTDALLRVWRLHGDADAGADAAPERRLLHHAAAVEHVDASPHDALRVASAGGADASCALWALDAPDAPLATLVHPARAAMGRVRFAPALRHAVFASSPAEGTLMRGDARELGAWPTPTPLLRPPRDTTVRDFGLSAYREHVVLTATAQGVAYAWDLRAPARPLAEQAAHVGAVAAVAACPHDERLAATFGAVDAAAHLWHVDADGMAPLRSVRPSHLGLTCAAWSVHDLGLIATGSVDLSVSVWNAVS